MTQARQFKSFSGHILQDEEHDIAAKLKSKKPIAIMLHRLQIAYAHEGIDGNTLYVKACGNSPIFAFQGEVAAGIRVWLLEETP